MFEPSLEHLGSLEATLAAPQMVGESGEGLRIVFPISGGEARGPRLSGSVLASGADWLLVRRDGVALLDVRVTIATADDAVIYAFYRGVTDLGEDGYEKARRGEFPPRLPLRTTPRFETGHPSYLWLNRLQCIGIGEALPAEGRVAYDLYALR